MKELLKNINYIKLFLWILLTVLFIMKSLTTFEYLFLNFLYFNYDKINITINNNIKKDKNVISKE